jgi:hypothetical protein
VNPCELQEPEPLPSMPQHDWLQIVWMGIGIAVLAILIFDLVWYLKYGDSLSRRMLQWMRPHPVWQWVATILGFLGIWHLFRGFPWDWRGL